LIGRSSNWISCGEVGSERDAVGPTLGVVEAPGTPGRIAVIIILALVVGLGAIRLAFPSGGNEGSKGATPPPGPGEKQIEAPIGVKRLPYYDSSWTFTEAKDGTIEVRDLHGSDKAGKVGVKICNLTRSSGNEDRDVEVLGSDGDHLAHHFQESLFSSGTCEKDQ
jgi:hypothetical protein